MRVDDTARPAGGAARVAHGGGLALVELRVFPFVRIGGREQLLVRVLDDEDVLDRRLLPELLEQRQQRAVDDHGAVARMARDVAQVARVQPEVERVEDEATARDAEVRLVVLIVVPAQRRNAVAALEAGLAQRDGQLPRAAQRLAVVRAVEALVGEARDDLAVAEELLRPAQQVSSTPKLGSGGTAQKLSVLLSVADKSAQKLFYAMENGEWTLALRPIDGSAR